MGCCFHPETEELWARAGTDPTALNPNRCTPASLSAFHTTLVRASLVSRAREHTNLSPPSLARETRCLQQWTLTAFFLQRLLLALTCAPFFLNLIHHNLVLKAYCSFKDRQNSGDLFVITQTCTDAATAAKKPRSAKKQPK